MSLLLRNGKIEIFERYAQMLGEKMKARLLQKALNTKRCVHETEDKICVASAYVHDLIHIKKDDMTVHYALDTFRQGRDSLTGKGDNDYELLKIYDKLTELVQSGEIQIYLDGDDDLENPLPVFRTENGELISTFTDAYGFPNVTISGRLMYDNDHFKTAKEALEAAIKDEESAIKYTEKHSLPEARERLEKLESHVRQCRDNKKTYTQLLSKI